MIEKEENGNIKITYEGEAGNLNPRIKDIEVSTSTNKIEVKINGIRADKYIFYIQGVNDSEYVKKEENKTGEYLFERLEANKEYKIKVEAINEHGKDEKEVTVVTEEIPELTEAEVKYKKSNTNWTNDVELGIITTIELNTDKNINGYFLQYTKFAEGEDITTEKLQNAAWEDYISSGIISKQNETIYSRLYDGINATTYTSTTISNIDIVKPKINTALNSSGETTNGFTLNIGVEDVNSGLGKIEWYYKLSTEETYTKVEEIYTELNGSITGLTSETTKSLKLDKVPNGIYSAYAIVYDVAGNSTQSETIQITIPYIVTFKGTIITSNGASSVIPNATYTATLTVPNGYIIDSLTIKMGEQTLEQNIGYTYENNILTIPNVNGDIEITAIGRELRISDLKVGDYIKYNSGTNGVITCRVLYNDATKGLQIVSNKNVKDVPLGSTTYSTSVSSYNSAIVTLNDEAEKYINTKYAYDARCVGSMPTINANGTFSQKDSGATNYVTLKFTNSKYSKSLDGDKNYENDEIAMNNAGIWNTGERYWLANRKVDSESTYAYFNVSYVNTSGVFKHIRLTELDNSGNAYGYAQTFGLRPCISIKSDIKITGGSGKTENTAYVIE